MGRATSIPYVHLEPSLVRNGVTMADTTIAPSGVLAVLPCADVEAALDFYTNTLGFTEILRQPGPDGRLVDARVAYAGGQVMLNLNPDLAPQAGGGVYLWFRLFEDDIDELYERLVASGVHVVEEIGDRFWGDRSFTVTDHAGFHLAFNKALADGDGQ